MTKETIENLKLILGILQKQNQLLQAATARIEEWTEYASRMLEGDKED